MCSPWRAASSALREEGDGAKMLAAASCLYFYPRPPRGGRLAGYIGNGICRAFLSTPSVRRATPLFPVCSQGKNISIHALREEGDAHICKPSASTRNFYPRPPRGGRQFGADAPDVITGISIHALREEGDAHTASLRPRPSDFYPRPPRGGRPIEEYLPAFYEIISIHALREEGDNSIDYIFLYNFISIHALREEGDPSADDELGRQSISIHALREEGDISLRESRPPPWAFLSTPSARRATHSACNHSAVLVQFLSTPSARRATNVIWAAKVEQSIISIHALREEGDILSKEDNDARDQFLSTSSARRVTERRKHNMSDIHISIHALREEGDTVRCCLSAKHSNFYPRPPRGGRPGRVQGEGRAHRISIHALREEGD